MKAKYASMYRLIGATACGGAVMLMACGVSGQNLYVSTYSGGTIDEITPGGAESVFASGMSYPVGLAFNSAGDLFVGNSANNNGESGNITEIAPNGTQTTFASGVDPQGIAINSAGNLFQVDYRSGNVYEYTPKGVQSTFATGFSFPLSAAVNSSGDLFVGAGYGNGNGYITEITPNGTQSLFASGLDFPAGLAFNSAGNLFASDTSNGDVYEFTPNGVRSTFATLNESGGLAFNSAGNLFVADSASSTIVEITPGGQQSTFASVTGLPDDLAFQPVPEPSLTELLCAGAVVFFLPARGRKLIPATE